MEQQTSDLFDLQVDQQARIYLNETARWSKFLSIVGFVMCAIIVVMAFFAGSILTAMGSQFSTMFAMGGVFFTIIYLLIALLYFFPCLYLYNFSTKLKMALASNDQVLLNTALKNQKACFRYLGILTLIILSFYALILVVALIGVGMR
jgi:hypothetical protein